MEPENEQLPTISIQDYLGILRRRRMIIIQSFVLILVVGIVVALMSKPEYHASARLLVDGPSTTLSAIDTANPLSSILSVNQQQTVDTQVEVLQAAPLLDRVRKAVGPAALSVASVKDTNVIEVKAVAQDPKVAAAAPNTLLQYYIEDIASQSSKEVDKSLAFVEREGAKARGRLQQSEEALRTFKERNHVAGLTKNRDDQIARVTAVTGDLDKARTDLASVRAQIATAKRLMAAQPQTMLIGLKATNAHIDQLKEQIRALEVQRRGLTQPGIGYLASSPQIVALDAQLNDLRTRLQAEPPLVVTQASNPNAVRESLRAKITELQTQAALDTTEATRAQAALAQAQAQVGHFANWELTMARLTRANDDAAAADKNFRSELADLRLRAEAQHASARVIESARTPTQPLRPKIYYVLMAAVIGLFASIVLALLQEFLDDRINTPEDANRLLGLPALGFVPALSATDAKLLPQMKGLDPSAESYRVLRTNIHFASVDSPAKTLLVTSAGPGEGKSTTAANLGYAMALDGKRVILVDTDLRRPSLHKIMKMPSVPGLTDVMLDHATLDEVLLESEEIAGLRVMTSGSTPPNPAELLGSRKFQNVIAELSDMADVVIFDSPPLLVAADAQILSSRVSGVVLVVEPGETKKVAASRAYGLLKQSRANVLGVAYNKLRVLDGNNYYYQYSYSTPGSLEQESKNRLLGRPKPALAETAVAVAEAPPAETPPSEDEIWPTQKF